MNSQEAKSILEVWRAPAASGRASRNLPKRSAKSSATRN